MTGTGGQERKYLQKLTVCVRAHLAALDAEMAQPSTVNRGRRVAALCNSLELANDQARRFGLGIGPTEAGTMKGANDMMQVADRPNQWGSDS